MDGSHTPLPLCVEVHPAWDVYRPAATPKPYRIDHLLRRVVWSDATARPWGEIQLTFRARVRDLFGPLPSPGDWIVIRSGDGAPAMTFGRIGRTAGRLSAQAATGAVQSEPVTIAVTHWWNVLGETQIYRTDDAGETVGTLFAMRDRWALWKAIEGTFKDVGAGLAAVMPRLGRVLLPPSLGDAEGDKSKPESLYGSVGTIGTFLQVIHSPGTAFKFSADGTEERKGAPRRDAEAIPSRAIPDLQSAFVGEGISAMDVLTGTFSADPNLTELFPSLEDAAEVGANAPQALASFGRLGRLPTLLFRMRPWRTEPLATYAERAVRAGVRGARGPGVAAMTPVLPIDPGLFTDVTWRESRAQRVFVDEVVSLSFDQSWDHAINATTIDFPHHTTQLPYLRGLGLPIYAPNHAALLGVQLYTVHWPFFRTFDAAGAGAADGGELDPYAAGTVGNYILAFGVEIPVSFPVTHHPGFPTSCHATRKLPIDTIILHQSGGATNLGGNTDSMIGKGLGVHFQITGAGIIHQYGDLLQALRHGNERNDRSVAIELLNPTRPEKREPRTVTDVGGEGGLWTVVKTSAGGKLEWEDTPQAMEALSNLTHAITTGLGDAEPLTHPESGEVVMSIPASFPTTDEAAPSGGSHLYTSVNTVGILAHGHRPTGHVDARRTAYLLLQRFPGALHA